MKFEIAIGMWGHWVERWRKVNMPVIQAEASDIGATIAIYTDDAGRQQLAGDKIDEFRDLPPRVGWFDQADSADADAIDRALAGDYAVAPLVASLRLGRGTLLAAKKRLEAGYRACMALCIPGAVPPITATPAELAERVRGGGVNLWDSRATCSHPGHYAWRAPNGAILVRPIYHHPVLIRPTRAYTPTRAVDHFMTEGYLDDISQVVQLDPVDGFLMGVHPFDGSGPEGPPPQEHPRMKEIDGIVDWMLNPNVGNSINAMPWNLHYMWHRFWCGDPGADREEVETRSDEAIRAIRKEYFARTAK